MKTVIFDARHLHSGIGTYILGLLDQLHGKPLPFRLQLIGKRDQLSKRYPRFDIIDCRLPIYSIGEQWTLPRLARHADLLHVPHFNVPLLYRGNFVSTVHDAAHYALPGLANSLHKRLYRNLTFRHVTRHARRIITVSDYSSREIMKYTGCPREKISVVHNGILQIFCDPQQHHRMLDSVIAQTLDGRPYFLYVGNFKAHKNITRMLRAFRKFKSCENSSHQLVLVGEGDERPAEAIEASDIHLFSGFSTERLVTIYRHAEAVLQLSKYEGFGLTPLEGMACGTPAIVSDIPALREVCKEAALYANPDSVDNIANQLRLFCNKPPLRQDLARAGYQRAEKFCWSQTAEKTVSIYEALLFGEAAPVSIRAFSP